MPAQRSRFQSIYEAKHVSCAKTWKSIEFPKQPHKRAAQLIKRAQWATALGGSEHFAYEEQGHAGTSIVYTYDTFWEESTISWASRWDAYLKMPGGRVHWFSILNSLMVVLVMSSIVAMIMLRTIRRDLARYETILGDTGEAQICIRSFSNPGIKIRDPYLLSSPTAS